jgi:hypothetical protein
LKDRLKKHKQFPVSVVLGEGGRKVSPDFIYKHVERATT